MKSSINTWGNPCSLSSPCFSPNGTGHEPGAAAKGSCRPVHRYWEAEFVALCSSFCALILSHKGKKHVKPSIQKWKFLSQTRCRGGVLTHERYGVLLAETLHGYTIPGQYPTPPPPLHHHHTPHPLPLGGVPSCSELFTHRSS